MAFVFRSPRNLGYTNQDRHQQQSQLSSDNNDQLDRSQNKKNKKKQPVKGLSLKKVQKLQQEKGIILNKDAQIVQNIHSRQSNNKNSNVSQQQFFFKSKCDRRVLSDHSKYIQQNKIKQFMQKQFCRKIIESKPKVQVYINKNRPTIIQQPKIKQKSQVFQVLQRKLPRLMSKEAKSSGISMNLLHSKKLSNKIHAIPSIPGKCQKFGYVLKQSQLQYPKNVSRPRFQGQKSDLPGPGDYQIRQRKKIKGVLKFKPIRNQLNKSVSHDFYALIEDQEALKKHNQKIKEWVRSGKQNKKKKKTIIKIKQRYNLQTRQSPNDSDESGITIYDDDETPGPGYYHHPLPNFKNSFRSNNQKFSKIFFSQAQRFEDFNFEKSPTSSLHISGNLQEKQQLKSQNRNKFFISKLQRSTKIQNQSDAPSPGYYDIRISMQNDIINKILRNSPYLFNNKLPRLADPVSSIAPGPGYYDTSLPEFKVQSFKPQYLTQEVKIKKEKDCFKQSEKLLIECSKQIRKTHQKKDNVIQKQNKAPFLSSSPKKLNFQNPSLTDYHTSFAAENSIKQRQKQNLYAFNSSAEKSIRPSTKTGTEIGLYDMSNYMEWDRKSYNVLFN